jgi:hypothetical protein
MPISNETGQRFAQYINRTCQRSGTLWEGRFRSCLAQNNGYLLSCYRYIELNPVRAGMVTQPGKYRWTSYRSNGQGEHQDWLTPHPEYLALGNNQRTRLASYRDLPPLSTLHLSRKSAAQPTATTHRAMIASSQRSNRWSNDVSPEENPGNLPKSNENVVCPLYTP